MNNNFNACNYNALVNKMRKTIETHNMLTDGDRVVIGVSGGADSVALLRALHALRTPYNLTLIVCHVNHKIRPGAAERDQRFVEELCRELGVECHVKEAHVEALAKDWGMSDEEAGRKVRYDFFNEIAGHSGKIATAHNKNDNAETVMMRFMRGTGLHGLTGIPYCRDNIIRPILDISRDEIERYLEEVGQDHITDETNLQPIYTRNKIRLNLIPEIKREYNPNFVETLANNISNYRDEDDFMSQEAERVVKRCFEIESEKIWINKNKLREEHVAIIKRAIKMAFNAVFNKDLSSQSVNNIVEMLGKETGTKLTVVGDVVASIQHSGVIIDRGNEANGLDEIEVQVVEKSGEICINEVRIGYEVTFGENVVNNATTFYCPIAVCKEGLVLRARRNGDMIVVAPGIRKKLKKFFIDNKIDAYNRNDYLLLVNSNGEVVWIPGLFGSRLGTENRNGEFVKFTAY